MCVCFFFVLGRGDFSTQDISLGNKRKYQLSYWAFGALKVRPQLGIHEGHQQLITIHMLKRIYLKITFLGTVYYI